MVPAEGILLRLQAGRRPENRRRALSGLVSLLGARRPRCVIVDPSAASFQEVIRRHGEYRVIPAKTTFWMAYAQVSTALKEGAVEICRPCKDSIREFGLYAGIRRETRTARSRKTTTLWMISGIRGHGPLG
mgnify:CR=1 FL=1